MHPNARAHVCSFSLASLCTFPLHFFHLPLEHALLTFPWFVLVGFFFVLPCLRCFVLLQSSDTLYEKHLQLFETNDRYCCLYVSLFLSRHASSDDVQRLLPNLDILKHAAAVRPWTKTRSFTAPLLHCSTPSLLHSFIYSLLCSFTHMFANTAEPAL